MSNRRTLTLLAPLVLGAWISIATASCGHKSTSGAIDAATGSGSDAAGSGSGSACTSDTQCAQPTPYCEPQVDVCVGCLSNTNCSGNTRNQTCSTTSHTCVQCAADTQCGGTTPYCSTAGACVQCLADTNCPTGDVCDMTSLKCVPKCTTSANCQAPLPVCNTTTDECVQCLASTDCTSNTYAHVCDTTDDRCVQCNVNADCTTAQAPDCDTASHRCVQCLTNTDCPTNTPTCTQGYCH